MNFVFGGRNNFFLQKWISKIYMMAESSNYMLRKREVVLNRTAFLSCAVLFLFVFLITIASAGISVYGIFDADSARDFEGGLETSQVLLKVSLGKGGVTSRNIGFSTDKGGEVRLEILGVPGVSLDEDLYVVGIDERKDVKIVFDSSGLEPGAYVGKVKISGGGETLFIPIVFEVESEDVFYDVNLEIPPQYNIIEPGGKLFVQLKFFDLASGGTTDGLGASTVNTEYILYSFDGEVISTETESFIVDKQTSTTKTISLPRDIGEGDYVFVAIARYSSSVGISTQLFSVSRNGGQVFESPPLNDNVSWNFFIVLVIFVAFFMGLVSLFVYLIHDRDKLFMELKRHNSLELKKQREFLAAQGRVLKFKRAGHPKDIKKEIKEKVGVLKKKQRDRVKEFRKLGKEGNTKTMLKKLRKWEGEGYKTSRIEFKLKETSVKDMKEIMDKWRAEGYKGGKGSLPTKQAKDKKVARGRSKKSKKKKVKK
jgi:hypothetical protein